MTKNAISRLPDEPPLKSFVFNTQQIFGKPDAAKLKNDKDLNAAGQYLQENKFGLAVVAARGGVIGESDKVRVLTEAQAMVIREYLAQNFRLDDARVKTIGLGKTSNSSEGNQIAILVYPSK